MKQLGQFRLKKELKVLSHWKPVNVYYEHAASKHRPYLKYTSKITWGFEWYTSAFSHFNYRALIFYELDFLQVTPSKIKAVIQLYFMRRHGNLVMSTEMIT